MLIYAYYTATQKLFDIPTRNKKFKLVFIKQTLVEINK